MTTLDLWEVKEEFVVFLRNQDVLTITERSVTTDSDTGTFASDDTHLINVNNVRNIRSITVDASPLTLGTDYTVEYTYNDSGTIKCQLSFTSSQTGDYEISYDYGTDAIFPDYPRDDLTLSNYPRIAVDILASSSEETAVGGGTLLTNLTVSITAYAASERRLEEIIQAIRDAVITNKKALFTVSFITLIGLGPMLKSPERHNKIVQRNIDVSAPLIIEEA